MSIDRLRHMDEKLKGLPLWKKVVIGAGDVALGVALGTGCAEAIKPVETPDIGSKTPETTPTDVVINIEDMIPVPENFRGSGLSGKIVSMEPGAEAENIPLYTKAQDALMTAGQRYGIEGGTTYILSMLNLVDDSGNKQDLILGLVLDSLGQEITPSPDPQGNVQIPVSAIFFYTESDGLAFVPPGEGLPIAGGRMLPLGYWQDGDKAYLGFGVEGSGATLPVFEMTQEGKLIYHDPYSGLAIEVQQNQFPTAIGKALYELAPMATPTAEPTATQVPTPEAPAEFSEKYPPEWSEKYIANVGGMEIPISVGLTHQIRTRSSDPVSEIHIAPDMVDPVGDYFMHMCFWRYTQLMNHPEVTYDQYLELVAKGEGQVEIASFDESRSNQNYPEVGLIDPQEGFSLVFTDGALPINYIGRTIYYGNSVGRALFVNSFPYSNMERARSEVGSLNGLLFVDVVNFLMKFGSINNECLMSGDVFARCHGINLPSIPPGFNQWLEPIRKEQIKYINGSRVSPPFLLVEP